ncbi:MAG: hypothetical protein ACRET4_18440 [Steroidobacteraceae bacterium]
MKNEQNQDSVAEATLIDAEFTGWDPFQIWRTRVREPQLRAQAKLEPRAAEELVPLRRTA